MLYNLSFVFQTARAKGKVHGALKRLYFHSSVPLFGAKCFNTDGTDWKCPFCVIEDLMYEGEKVYFMAIYVCICMHC